jgi:hypothetical protein
MPLTKRQEAQSSRFASDRSTQRVGMIHMTTSARGFLCAVSFSLGLVSVTPVGVSGAGEPRAGLWSGGTTNRFLCYTSDGIAFATNVHADYI